MILVGLEENRQLTEAFIMVSPVSLALQPRTSVADGTGGRLKPTGTPRSPQVFSLLEPSYSGFSEPLVTADGKQYTVDFMLLGRYDAVVAVDDVFTYDGREYKIVAVMPDNGYEKRAVVLRHGW